MNRTRGISDITLATPQQWERARACLSIIQRLAGKSNRKVSDVDAAAAELGCSRAQIYVLLNRYQDDPRLTSLVPRRRGPPSGQSRLAIEIDRLVDETIEAVYLTRQRPRIADLVTEVRRRCHALGLCAPGRKAIQARLRAKPPKEVLARREGRKAARDRFAPVTGSLEALWPLSVVQIDHTLVDVIVVDSVTRLPIQRPWITLAIDVFSRCVAGFHLSLEPPSATSVALCIAHAALTKDAWLARLGVDDDWPICGIPQSFHLDNAKEFRSEALRRGCEQYGIAIAHRPVRTPHYGGHIERLIGTMMGKVHLLPGTTFSDVRVKGDLDPEKYACMTIDEVERWLTHAIAGVYHRTVHRALGTTPLDTWERGISGDATTVGRGKPLAVSDPRRFLIDFLPIARRRIGREGISLNGIHYFADVLRTWIGEREKMLVRYDPRDLSRIYLHAPDGQYYDVSYRQLSRPPITLWEHRLALARLREQGCSRVDEEAIFRTIGAMRQIVDDAKNATKRARRQRERRLRLMQGERSDATPAAEVSFVEEEGTQGTEQPWERMFPVEEW